MVIQTTGKEKDIFKINETASPLGTCKMGILRPLKRSRGILKPEPHTVEAINSRIAYTFSFITDLWSNWYIPVVSVCI